MRLLKRAMTRIAPAFLALSLVLGAVACGDDDDGKDTPLELDVLPVDEGEWYQPVAATTWQWQLTGTINTAYDVDVYDIDLFDSSTTLIARLQTSGKKVICYFSAGSSEDWLDDFADFDASDMGNDLDGWAGEKWLDIRSANVHTIMLARLDVAQTKGCDGVEPDNMDGFTNNPGFSLTADDQLAYNRFIANAAHERGLSVGLKNDGGQAAELVDYFDFSVNEECHDYEECSDLAPFTAQDKPIFNAEYVDRSSEADTLSETLCPAARSENIRTLILPWDLDDSFRVSCEL